MIVSNRINMGSRPHWAETFGTRVNEIESRYPRRLPPLLGGNGLNECYRPYFGTGALHACPELIGLPTLRLFFQNIPIPLCLNDLSKQTALRWIVARAQPRVADRQSRDQRGCNRDNSHRFRTTYRGRNREYSLRESEVQTLIDLGKFRVVPTDDLAQLLLLAQRKSSSRPHSSSGGPAARVRPRARASLMNTSRRERNIVYG